MNGCPACRVLTSGDCGRHGSSVTDAVGTTGGKVTICQPPQINVFRVIPGSARCYCRVEGCTAFTWANVRFGYCPMHLQQHLSGMTLREKLFPPPNAPDPGQQGSSYD